MRHSRTDTPSAVVQKATQAHYDPFKGRFNQLFEAVVLRTYYVDDRDNASAQAANVVGDVEEGIPEYLLETGYRIECDIYTLITSHRGGSYQRVQHVPVMQRGGGLRDTDIWTPKGSSNFRQDQPFDPAKLDGDVVLVQCIGGVWPKGAVIIGSSPHKRNFFDGPRSVNGERGTRKEFGDRERKDGHIRLVRYNGAVCPYIDRTGNLIFNTVEANHKHAMDPNTGRVDIQQDELSWTTVGDVAPTISDDNSLPNPSGEEYPGGLGDGDRYPKEVASPGGGDVTFQIKDSRRIRFEFQDNQRLVEGFNSKNPRQFVETGFIQIHKKDSGTRTIEIAASDDLVINIRKYGDGSGSVTINCEKDLDGIKLGGADVDSLATQAFVREIFLAHTHMTSVGQTGPPQIGVVVPTSLEDMSGKLVPDISGTKVVTTKVVAE